MAVEVSAAVMSTKMSLNLHGDQASISGHGAMGELGIKLVDPGRISVRYSVITPLSIHGDLIPTDSMVINETDFGKKQTQGQQSQSDQKPVSVDVTMGTSQKIEFTCLRLGKGNFWLNPAFVGQWVNIGVTATGEKDGKQVSDTETFRSFLYGAGAEAVYDYGYSRCHATVVASDKYLFGRFAYQWAISNNLDCEFGYEAEQMKLERESIARTQAIYGRIVWGW